MKSTIMLTLSHKKSLSLKDAVSIADGARVRLSPDTVKMLTRRRKEIDTFIKRHPEPHYGFNRGFGHNVDTPVDPRQLKQLQKNLIRSHSAGVGEPLDRKIVRIGMLLRANSLARGHSAVRPQVIQKILELLNKNITPCVPSLGSVGASGDLAPLSHIALALIGEGHVFVKDEPKARSTPEVFKKFKISPLELHAKEGLALNNGVQISTAMGVYAYFQASNLLEIATVNSAIATQVLLGSDEPFSPELQALRPHHGAKVVANWLTKLIKNSPLRKAHQPVDVDGEVQDPYSLRCAPQILGACYDLLEDARRTLEIEINSATDNPLVLSRKVKGKTTHTRIVSGGHFHGMPIATRLYGIMQSLGIMAQLSNLRCARFVDENRNKGLGSDLIWPLLNDNDRSTSSGLMILEYASAALTNFVWGESMPSHLFSISTDAGQEDHVSMSATLGLRILNTLPKVANLMALELIFCAQAAAIRKVLPCIPSKISTPTKLGLGTLSEITSVKAALSAKLGPNFNPKLLIKGSYRLSKPERKLSPICEELLQRVYRIVPPVTADRALYGEISSLAQALSSGSITRNLQRTRVFS